MSSTQQPGDKLRAILARAREQTPAATPEASLGAGEVAASALVDKNAALPDPRALSRLYRSSELTSQLPDDAEERARPSRAQGWEQLPPLASRSASATTEVYDPDASVRGGPGNEPDAMARPSMTPAEMRGVMAELQTRFQVTDRSYETYELSSKPVDDIPVGQTAEERRAEEAAELAQMAQALKGTWVYFVGAAIVLVVVGVFIFIALNGPFKATPSTSSTPSPTTSSPAAARP